MSAVTGQGHIRFGVSTARNGNLKFINKSTSTAAHVLLGATHEGAAIGGQIKIYADDITPTELPNSGGLTVQGPVIANAGFSTTTVTASGLVSANAGLSTTTITASGLVSANAGLSATTVTASGLVSANAGLSATTVTASGLVSANAGFSATSTTLNGINLSSNITEGIRIITTSAALGAVTLNVISAAINSIPIRFGRDSLSGNSGNMGFTYNGSGLTTNSMSLGFTGGSNSFVMFNSAATASTLSSPLTVTGLVTGTNLSATSFTALRVASIDASKNLISTDQALLKIAASNADFSLLGSSIPDGSSNTRIVISGNSRSGVPGEITYIATGANGAHVWWTGGTTEKMRLSNAGNLTVTGTVAANPRRGFKFQNINQTVSASSEVILNQLNTDNNSGPLTPSGSGYFNNTGGFLVILFTYSVFWDPAFGGGAVQASLIKNQVFGVPITGEKYGGSSATVFGATYNCSCTGSAIIALNNGEDVSLWVRNNLGGNLDVKGGAAFGTNITQLYYYILN